MHCQVLLQFLKLFSATPCDVEFHFVTMLSKWPRGLLLIFAAHGDDQGEYMPKVATLSVSVQGLSDALTALDTEVTEVPPPSEEFALQLRVTMADYPGHLHPPVLLWNVGMVLYVLKKFGHADL